MSVDRDVQVRAMEERLFRTFFGEREGEKAPRFASDIGVAWILLSALLRRYRWVDVIGTDEGRWICRIQVPRHGDRALIGCVSAEARSAPLAICRAAHRTLEPGRTEETAPIGGPRSRSRDLSRSAL